MNPRLKLLAQTLIHHPVAGYQLDVPELVTDYQHLEVSLGTLGHIVHVGLVDNLQVEWRELRSQFPLDGLEYGTR